ncbi:cytochrome c551 [Macrococcoides caseolyticum]|uniref:cytochrome c551 n=1 Tax=Macrococcoides caseolyticum TaxID=69966 RepID=UPI001F30DBC4|nr:cytochrome c [Macrococcus caseolyticus]MCE4955845.1 cytochrome c [Macrococcus caseolyticus]
MKKLLTGIALSALILGACGNNAEKKTSESSSNDPGREAYANSSCIGCHGRDLEGGSGPNLTKVGNKYSEQEILKIIQNGKGSMPKNLVKGKDAENIAKYLAKQK